MPLPKPKAKETKSKFISRCLVNPNVKKDFTLRGQAYAVCNSLFKK